MLYKGHKATLTDFNTRLSLLFENEGLPRAELIKILQGALEEMKNAWPDAEEIHLWSLRLAGLGKKTAILDQELERLPELNAQTRWVLFLAYCSALAEHPCELLNLFGHFVQRQMHTEPMGLRVVATVAASPDPAARTAAYKIWQAIPEASRRAPTASAELIQTGISLLGKLGLEDELQTFYWWHRERLNYGQFCALLNSMPKRAFEEIIDIYETMLKQDFPPPLNDYLLARIVTSYGMKARWAEQDRAFKSFRERFPTSTAGLYAAKLQSLVRKNQPSGVIEAHIAEFDALDITPSLGWCQWALAHYVKQIQGNTEAASRILDAANTLYAGAHASAVHGLSLGGDRKTAGEWVDSALATGQLSTALFSVGIDNAGFMGDTATAIRLFELARQKNKASENVWCSLLEAMGRCRNMDLLVSYYKQMTQTGWILSDKTRSVYQMARFMATQVEPSRIPDSLLQPAEPVASSGPLQTQAQEPSPPENPTASPQIPQPPITPPQSPQPVRPASPRPQPPETPADVVQSPSTTAEPQPEYVPKFPVFKSPWKGSSPLASLARGYPKQKLKPPLPPAGLLATIASPPAVEETELVLPLPRDSPTRREALQELDDIAMDDREFAQAASGKSEPAFLKRMNGRDRKRYEWWQKKMAKE